MIKSQIQQSLYGTLVSLKKCFHTPHSTWLNNSMSHFDTAQPDAAQTFSFLASDCVTTILSCSSFSPPLHCQWSSSAAVWLLTIKRHISALFLMFTHYHNHTIMCPCMRAFSVISGWWHAHQAVWHPRGGAAHDIAINPRIARQHGSSNSRHEGSAQFCLFKSQQTLN